MHIFTDMKHYTLQIKYLNIQSVYSFSPCTNNCCHEEILFANQIWLLHITTGTIYIITCMQNIIERHCTAVTQIQIVNSV